MKTFHAGQPTAQSRRSPAAADRGDPSRIRFDVPATTRSRTCEQRPTVWKKKRWRSFSSRWWARGNEQRFYPDFSGVVRSRELLSCASMTFEARHRRGGSGTGGPRASMAEKCLTFCPRYRKTWCSFPRVEDILANSQSEFWAWICKGGSDGRPGHWHEKRFPLEAAESDGTLQPLASTVFP